MTDTGKKHYPVSWVEVIVYKHPEVLTREHIKHIYYSHSYKPLESQRRNDMKNWTEYTRGCAYALQTPHAWTGINISA